MNSVIRPRDPWCVMCEIAALVSFVAILAYVLLSRFDGIRIPYAGGAAVVLGLGATVALSVRSRTIRISVALALVGLICLRMMSALLPGVFIATHGRLSLADGLVLGSLLLAAIALSTVGWRTRTTA